MPTLKPVVAGCGRREENSVRYWRLKRLQNATAPGQCAAGSNALLCASERGASYRYVAGFQRYSFGEGPTGSRHLHHLAGRRGGRAAGQLAGPGRRDARSRRGVSGTGRGARAMGSSLEELGLCCLRWRRPWRLSHESLSGETAR